MPGASDIAAAILGKPEGGGGMDDDSDDSLEAAAEDLVAAVNGKDVKGVAEALRNAFAVLESEPHEESGRESE